MKNIYLSLFIFISVLIAFDEGKTSKEVIEISETAHTRLKKSSLYSNQKRAISLTKRLNSIEKNTE